MDREWATAERAIEDRVISGVLWSRQPSTSPLQRDPVLSYVKMFRIGAGGNLGRGDTDYHSSKMTPAVAVANKALVRRVFPSGAAVGQRIRLGADPRWRAIEIVGVVGNTTLGKERGGA